MVLVLWWRGWGGVAQPPCGAGGGFWGEDSHSVVWAGRSRRPKGFLHVMMGEPQSMMSWCWDSLDEAHV